MSILVHTDHYVPRRSGGSVLLRSACRLARAALGWPLRVHANRKVLNQMAGMSAYELADIGLTLADIQDTSALSLDTDVGQFLSSRVAARRFARNTPRLTAVQPRRASGQGV